MSRQLPLGNPLLLGFEALEETLDRVDKLTADGYPPYNIEQIGNDRIRIVLAVAGFGPENLSVDRHGDQLTIRGRNPRAGEEREFLHRGIASRQFQRSFLLADGLKVEGAHLRNGLLTIELQRPVRPSVIEQIPIRS